MDSNYKEIKTAYGKLFSAVSEALFQADPIGICFGENSDEYDPEAGTIIPRLKTANSAQGVQAIIYEEFRNWFGADTAGDQALYQAVSINIWELWSEFQHHQI